MTNKQVIKYSYNDCPTIRQFAQSDAFIRGLMGPIGSGKSSGCAVEMIRRGLAQRPGPDGIRKTKWVVIRNSYPNLRDTTIQTVHQWFPPQHFGQWKVAEHRYIMKAFENTEIEIIFRALDKPDDVRNLLSLEVTGAWVNEAKEIDWPVIDMLGGRVGRYPAQRDGGPTWSGVFMDTNPPDSDSRWWRYFEDNKHPPGHAEIFKQPSGRGAQAENLDNLPGGRMYYDRLVPGKTAEWVKVFVDGEYGFVMDGKLVFPEYNDRIHCQEVNPIPGVPIHRGWDMGLTGACVLSQVLPDGRWLVFDEIIADGMGIDRFSEQVITYCSRAFPQGATFIDTGDPAGQQRAQTDERTCFDILQAKGIDIDPGIQTLTIRLESLRKPLRTLENGEPAFVLHPRCKTLRKAFMGGYHYRRKQVSGREQYIDVPDKNWASHPVDALGYTGTILFGGGLTRPPMDESDTPWDNFGFGADYAADSTRSKTTGY